MADFTRNESIMLAKKGYRIIVVFALISQILVRKI